VGSPGELACRPGLFRDLLEASKEEQDQQAKSLQSCPLINDRIPNQSQILLTKN
jgi:hypothetical protein